MKARSCYRIYLSCLQRLMLVKIFGCGCDCVVNNDAIRLCRAPYRQEEKIRDTELQKRVITQAKLAIERCWLSGAASVPLVQFLQNAHLVFCNFFKSLKGEWKGYKVDFLKFQKKSSTPLMRFTRDLPPMAFGLNLIRFTWPSLVTYELSGHGSFHQTRHRSRRSKMR